jgi:hypothetical protein
MSNLSTQQTGGQDWLTTLVLSDYAWYYYALFILAIVAILVPCAIWQLRWAKRQDIAASGQGELYTALDTIRRPGVLDREYAELTEEIRRDDPPRAA